MIDALRRAAGVSALLAALLPPTHAAQPFALTSPVEVGGGGCIGETRVYAESVTAQVLNDPKLNPPGAPRLDVAWRTAQGRNVPYGSYFLTTVGCGAEPIGISLDGKSHLLNAFTLDALGEPALYYRTDDAEAPRVRIRHLGTLRRDHFKDTDCTLRYDRVQVEIERKGARRTVIGTAINGCP